MTPATQPLDPLAPIPLITVRCVEPDARIHSLVFADRTLTAAEWEELETLEIGA